MPIRTVRVAVAACLLVVGVGISSGIGRADAVVPAASTGAAAAPGSATVGNARYAAPAGAVYLSTSGSDATSATGSVDRPVRTLARALALAPDGGTVVVRRGTYHEYNVVTRRVTVQNYPGEEVWFDGSQDVSGWVRDGSRWRHDGWTTRFDASPTYTKGAPDSTVPDWQFVNPAAPMAAHPDQMWVDGARLDQAASLGALNSHSFYLDEATSRLYVGADPTNRAVRASTLAQALSVRASGVTLRGIGFRRYAPSVWQLGAIVLEKPGATLENVAIREMSTTGLSILGSGALLHDVTVQLSGMLGIHGRYADQLTMNGVLSQQNNNEHFNLAPVAGGAKIGTSRGVLVENSEFSQNYGHGFWQDLSTYNTTYRADRFSDNTGNGLFLEISARAVVGDSLFLGNARDGLKVNNTSNVQIWNNTLIGNGRALDLVQDGRRNTSRSDAAVDPRIAWPDPEMPWKLASVTVGNNVVGKPGAAANCVLCVEDYSHTDSAASMPVVTNGNIYLRSSAAAPTWLAVWSRGPGNPSVYTSLAAFVAGTGQDRNSREYVGAGSVSAAGVLDATVQGLAGQVARPLPTAVATAIGRSGSAAHLGAWLDTTTGAPTTTPTATPTPTTTPTTAPAPAPPAPAVRELFHDEFNRTLTGGWGTADTGGSWTTPDAPTRFFVADGRGQVSLRGGDGFHAALPQVASTRTDLVVSLSVDKAAGAVGHYLSFTPRQVSGVGGYTARMRIAADGRVTFWLLDTVSGLETYFGQPTTAALTYTPGAKIWLRVQATGTAPTVLRARIWSDGAAEPTSWLVSAQDSTSSLQRAGGVDLFSYTGGSADQAAVTVRYHRLVVTG